MWQVVVGGFGDSGRLSNIELFPRPSSPSCSIPDLPQPRAGHSISLLSGGRLVVCGGIDDNENSLASCITWVAGNDSWTPLQNMRCHLITPQNHFHEHNHSMARVGHTAWTSQSLPGSIIMLGGNSSAARQTAETVPGIQTKSSFSTLSQMAPHSH